MTNNNAAPAVPTLVLDTNVCLDLFVFRDPRWTHLLSSMQSGAVQAITRSDCRDEWLAVLNYPRLKLDTTSQAACAAAFDALITCQDKPEVAPTRQMLPTCTDRDDQKFLELAFDAKADFLISKDKALLRLARRTERLGMFAIRSPEAWHKEAAMAAEAIPAL